ncbi:MAG: hypothetical protein II453_15420 [Alphaproteobacteria bacterium]|nr:hypothetical protein [Alphaproteobacteria bacterium]
MFGFFFALGSLIISIIRVILDIVEMIARGVVLHKKDESWWAIFIPVYNDYALFRDTGKRKTLTAYIITSLLFTAMTIFIVLSMADSMGFEYFADTSIWTIASDIISHGGYLLIAGILFVILFIVDEILSVILFMRLAACFGKSPLFGLGLFFIPVIFFPMLAFNKKTYFSPSYDF